MAVPISMIRSRFPRGILLRCRAGLLTIILALPPSAMAASKSWVGGSNSNWQTAANWSPSGVPGSADAVTIDANISVVANSSAISFSSLILGDANGTFASNLFLSTGLASAGSVLIYKKSGLTIDISQQLFINGNFTMQPGSSMTTTAVTATNNPVDAQIYLTLTGTGIFNLVKGSTVNLAGLGFAGGASRVTGKGPGGGGGSGANNYGGGGGGHGGAGGAGYGGTGGLANDTPTDPAYPGSGGGGGRSSSAGLAGGAGGGAFILNATSATIDGLITVNGAAGKPGVGPGGGGAGGTVNMTAAYFTGVGSISANGGGGGAPSSGRGGGGGGGGDISIDIMGSGSISGLSLSVAGGTSSATTGSLGVISTTVTVAAPTLTSVGAASSSIEWDWNGVVGGVNYQIFSSTGGLGQSPLLGAGATYYVESALTPNTTYTRYVVVTAGGYSANSTVFSTATLAAAPTAAAKTFNAVNAADMTVGWSTNGNPVGVTTYTVVLSTGSSYPNSYSGTVSISTVAQGATAAATLTGLAADTTYYLYVAAMNYNGIQTAFMPLGSTSTLASAPSNPVFVAVLAGSIIVHWTAPSAGTAAGYLLQASTASNFTGTIYSSATPNAVLSTLTVSGLRANTTYYFQVAGLNWNSVPSFTVWGGSTATLASPPSRLASDYIAVYYTSATLQWAALPQSPSSQTCEGYLLIASTAPDFTGTIYSSATPNTALSTLTISGLNLANTYYFQVGSLNPESVWNPVSLTQLNMQLSQSTAALSLGAMDPTVYSSTISISSFVVTNQGSLPVTIMVWASTMTQPSSPWTLGLAPDNETVLLQGVWNSVAPSSGKFNTAITNSTTTSTGSNYAGNQTGVSVPPGQSRTMWFQFWRPSSTVSNAKQSIQINAQAVYP